jgi:hypothetical protein
MQVESSLIARYAEPMSDGTMTLVGAFTLGFFSTPLPTPISVPGASGAAIGSPISFAVVTRLLYSRSEMNSPHFMEVRVNDPDGKPVVNAVMMPIATPDNPTIPAGGLVPTVVVSVNNFFPPCYGQYGVDVVVDGDTKKQLSFQVVQPPNQPLQQPGGPAPVEV